MNLLSRSIFYLAVAGSALGHPTTELQKLADAIVQGDGAAARQMIEGGTPLDQEIFGAKPLHLVAEYGRTEIAQMLLDRKVSVDPLDSIAKTPLLWAAENDHVEVARLLLAHGANPNQEDTSRFRGPSDDSPYPTPLDYAIDTGDIELCRLLLNRGAKVRGNDFTRLQRAVVSGKPSLLLMLIDKGLSPTAHSKEGSSAFASAGMSDNVEMIKILVEKSRGLPGIREVLNDALQCSAAYGKTAVANFLLDNKLVDLNREVKRAYGGNGGERMTDEKKKVPGYTALSRAIEENHDDIAEALLKKGARVTGRTQSGAPIISFVIAENRDDLFRLLIKYNPSLDQTDYDGRTALMTAALMGKVDFVKTLIEKGAPVTERDRGGGTALIVASENGQISVVEYLLAHGAALSERDDEGRDALMYAAAGGYNEICSLLVAKGANTNAVQTKTGMTALHWAARKGRAAAVRELLAHGASAGVIDKEGKKPIDYARLAGDPDCISELAERTPPGSSER